MQRQVQGDGVAGFGIEIIAQQPGGLGDGIGQARRR
jgi:hypothetical protein